MSRVNCKFAMPIVCYVAIVELHDYKNFQTFNTFSGCDYNICKMLTIVLGWYWDRFFAVQKDFSLRFIVRAVKYDKMAKLRMSEYCLQFILVCAYEVSFWLHCRDDLEVTASMVQKPQSYTFD